MLMWTSSPCTGSRNQFLAQLSRDDAMLLDRSLSRTAFGSGAVLIKSRRPLDVVYFPETIVVSIGEALADGCHRETAVVGYEGIVGWSVCAGSERATHDAIVQMSGGIAWCTSRQDLLRACTASTTLSAAVMRFADVIAVQMAQAIVSLLGDTVERRICRWLLMRHDRVVTDQLRVRHDEISGNLGIRRASVTDCLHVLEGERLVRCHRGRIVIRDRAGLERAAGGSYGEAETYYREQIGPFGRTVPTGFPSLASR